MALLIRTLLVLFVFAAGAAGASAAEAWRIVASTGAVKAGAPGMMPVAVNPKQDLPVDSWVETAATGRVVLARGAESIAIGPNSRVMLPALPVNGNTQVLQTMGSALYQIGKQKAPHFQVDTPYLAAVVKGTTFTVSVSEGVAAVDVTEGLVQVATPDGTDSAYVQPGFTGFVTRSQRDTVVVAPTGNAPGATDTPKGKAKVNPIGSPKDSSNTKDRVIITAAIGEVSIDVKSVSGGLVTGTATNVATKDTPTVGGGVSGASDIVRDAKSDTASNAPLGAASVDVGASGAGASVDVGGGLASVDVSAGGGGVVVGADVGGGLAGVDVSAGSGGVGVGVDVGGVAGVDVAAGGGGVSVDVGAGGAGVSVDLGVGGGNGNGNGNGNGLGLGIGIGAGGGGVTVGVGVGNGGVGVGIDLGIGGGGGGLLGGLLGGRHH